MYIHACIVNVHYNYSMNCFSITQIYFISSQGSGWVSWFKKKANMDFRNGMSCHDKEADHLSLLIFLMHLSYEFFISQRTHVTIKLPVSCSVGHLKKIHYNYDVTVLSTLRFRFKTTRYGTCARSTEYYC